MKKHDLLTNENEGKLTEWIHSTTFIIHEDIVNTFEVLAQVGEYLQQ